jgi:hypothetical protein
MTPESPDHETAAPWTRLLAVVICVSLIGAALIAPSTLAAPPASALQVIFRYFMLPMIVGEGAPPSPWSRAAYFVIVFPVVAGAIIVVYRRLARVVASGSYLGRAVGGFGILVLVTYLLNAGVQGGLGIPLALGYAVLLGLAWWEAQHVDAVRPVIAATVWAGIGFLISSGGLVPLLSGDARFELQRLHGIYGYLWMSVVGVYLIAHIAHYEAKRETSARSWGYAAATILSVAVLTGLARLHGGGETRASGLWPHVVAGAAAIIVVGVHAIRSWRKRGLGARLGPGVGTGRLAVVSVAVGIALPLVPIAQQSRRTADAFAANDDAPLAIPDIGVTATGPARALLAPGVVSVRESAFSCGKTGGCHVDTQAQWERSAHRFAANPAYRETVRLMVRDVGIERARLCAGCHDPVPLLTGRIVPGADYPFDDSEGVTCVVCHSMHPAADAKNGQYVVAPSPTFTGTIKDALTSYMMVAVYRDTHRADHLGPAMTDNSVCAPCHNLTTAHLVLRRTFDEWHAGPFGPGTAQSKSCAECHMPEAGSSYIGFPLHDHRMPAANVALAGLRGESPDREREFIAAALALAVDIEPRPGNGAQIRVRLANVHGAHAFPTAPRDLVDYWLEVQFEGAGITPMWQRLDRDDGLFAETLLAADGAPLTRHEIWRAVDAKGPEGIRPGEVREYVFPAPLAPAGVERATVRLMYRRYQDAFLRFLEPGKGALYTDAIELLRNSAEWRRADRAAAQTDPIAVAGGASDVSSAAPAR